MKGVFTRTMTGFSASDQAALDTTAKLQIGDRVTLELKRLRSPEQHRLFFGMLKIILDNSDRYASMDNLLDAVKIYAGHFEEDQFPEASPLFNRRIAQTMVCLGIKDIEADQIAELGRIWTQIKPKSIAFGNMNHDDFQAFFEKAAEFGGKVLGVDPLDLMREAQEV